MGLCNSPDIFQEQMLDLMHDLEYVQAYINDIPCITKDTFQDHLSKLHKVLHHLRKVGLKVNLKSPLLPTLSLNTSDIGNWQLPRCTKNCTALLGYLIIIATCGRKGLSS